MYTELEKSMFSTKRQMAATVAAFAAAIPGAYFITAGSVFRTLIAAVGTGVVAKAAEDIAFRIGR